MWKKFNEWFKLTKAESRGIARLFVLILIVWAVNFYLRYNFKTTLPTDFGGQIKIIDSLSAERGADLKLKNPYHFIGYFNPNDITYDDLIKSGLKEKNARSIENYRKKGGKFFHPEEVFRIFNIDSDWVAFQLPYMVIDQKKIDNSLRINTELFTFNPNTADSLDLIKLGFKPWQISNLIRYRERGGRFYQKKDLKRLYGLDSTFYVKIEPYIDLPSSPERHQASSKERILVELNSSDSAALTALPGIGPILAGRIVRYRQALGGFVNSDQLLEVYGIDSLKWEILLPFIEVNPSAVRKININTADVEELAAHPYIGKSLAREVVAFRKNFRMFKSVTEISNLSLTKNIDPGNLFPYLTVNDN